MNKITIDGKEYAVAFNVATLLAFERIAEHSFFEENFKNLYARVILIHAAMIAAGDQAEIDVIINANDWKEMDSAFTTVMNLSLDFFKIPKVLEDIEKKEAEQVEEEEDEEKKKN